VANLYVALVHHPVYDKNRSIVTTSVTNLDVHDIARSCRTFGVRAFYVVTPVDALRGLVRKIIRHWQEGYGSTYNETRREALGLVRLCRTLDDVAIDVESDGGSLPVLVATSAKASSEATGFDAMRAILAGSAEPHVLVLGTGWGLAEEVLGRCRWRLAPIQGTGDYNHLSVRAAAAIILDRLLGTR